jgi:hypothetical protein
MMCLPILPNGSRCISSPLRLPEGTRTSWQITSGLLIIICQDLAPRAPRGVNSVLEPPTPVVHQQLSCNMHIAGNRLGRSQRWSE